MVDLDRNRVRYIARAGLIAAIYCVLTVIFEPISFGPMQARLSEALVMLPLIDGAAIPGVAIGCFFANLFGGMGFVDVVFGSLTTLAAAYLTSKAPNRMIAVLPPVLLNAFIVSIWVSAFSHVPYWPTVFSIGLGEFFSVAGFGTLLLMLVDRIKSYR